MEATAKGTAPTGERFQRIRWLKQVHADPYVSPIGFSIAFAITDYINNATGEAFPSQAKIASNVRLSTRCVREKLPELTENGHLSVKEGCGRGHASIYRPILKTGTVVPLLPDERRRDGSTFSDKGGTATSERRNKSVIKAEHAFRTEPCLNLVEEPCREPSKKSSNENKGRKKKKTTKPARPKLPLPEDLSLTNAMLAFALKHAGWSAPRAAIEFEKFKNHHLIKATVSADWLASWRTWVINGKGFDNERASRAAAAGGKRGFDV